MSRRRFLLLTAGALTAGAGAYVYMRGVRYPPLQLAGVGPTTRAEAGGIEVMADGAAFQGKAKDAFRFRAFVPEPRFRVRGAAGQAARIRVENLHGGAQLNVEDSDGTQRSVSEEGDKLTRSITVRGRETVLSWRFPKPEQYRFAAIGDSGGGTELQWVLRRAADLGADFLIHLGDIYYEKGDFDRAAINLNSADIPTYAAIGNHDFHDSWRSLSPRFHQIVGPGSSVFRLGGIEFMNLDTAADFMPAARGRRAQMVGGLEPLGSDPAVRDRVAFTHMPLSDPEPERSHAVGRPAEARWLRSRLLDTGTRNLLVGHIHIKEEFDDQGLHTYITGQGLAHADLIGPTPYRRYAEILLGDVEPGEPVRYRWQPLNMPLEAHCNRRNMKVLDALERGELKERLLKQCGKA